MKSVESQLQELENKLCEKIVTNWEEDDNFSTLREMQQYNRGINEAMKLIGEIIRPSKSKVFNI